MAMSRYTIRNEYSLADPELYKSADKDDPEALLEGVAMAGLVGVLRQLGDLAQFAAEVFHNLHEEVMSTAARGHSLKARILQLEVEFPLIEKALLSQTNHSGFFYTAGVDWHPKVHIDQNYITKGDLPRFIMDSYEEARAPPRLFLLDKFDVAGAGACLKRFTDPSFYKVEAAAIGIANADVQRDKKLRKGKRRGVRWRNGETPVVQPTHQAKLHQLLLEERIENSTSNPARRVKLKRRLNGYPFDLKTGKSYMEKVLRTPPPDYRESHEVYNFLPLKLLENNFTPELENDDFGSESPGVELTHRSQFSSPDRKDGVRNVSAREMEFRISSEGNQFKPEYEREKMGLQSPDLLLTHRSPPLAPGMTGSVPNISIDEQELEASGIENKPKLKNNLEVSNITSILYDDAVEKHIMVDIERRSECSSVYQSDDVVSELENYMDALATVEPEMDSDSELRSKGNLHFPSNRKRVSALDAATPLRQANFSDSQSMGSNTLSDDGNSSSKKCKSSSSFSGSPRVFAKKAHLEDELSDKIDSYNDTGEAKRISSPLKWRGRTRNAGGSKVAAILPYSSDDVDQTFSESDVSPGVFAHTYADASVGENGVAQLKFGEMLSAERVRGAEPSKDTGSESNLNLNVPSDSKSRSTLQKMEFDSLFRVVAENHSSDDEDDSHLTETSSRLRSTPDDTCFTGGSKDQHIEELVDKNMYPLKTSPEELSENGLHEDLPNDEAGAHETIGVLSSASVPPSCCNEDTADEKMSQPSLENMPRVGDGEHDFDAYPEVNQIHLQITVMRPAEEQTMELRLPELETDIREIDAQSIAEIAVGAVSPPKEVAVEEILMSPIQRDLCSENFHISGMTDILQPLGPVDSSMDNQIKEQFPHMSNKQFSDTSFSEVEDCSDGSDHNVIIPGESTMPLPAGEIAVDMEDQALSGIRKGAETEDIQAPVVSDSVPQAEVDCLDNRDEILPEPPSLEVRQVTDVIPAGETDLSTVSPSVKPEICVSSEMHSSVTADNGARVETSSYQMENLHDLARLVGEKLEGVASSTDFGERRGNSDCELNAGSVNASDTVVEGSRVDSNLYGVDAEVPFSVTCNELNTEEKVNIHKVASPSMVYDHSESRILHKLFNSYSHSESESSLHTEITASSTLQHSGSHMNGVFAEKNTLDDDTVDPLPVPIYYDVEEPKINLPLQQLDAEETEAFRISGTSNMCSNITDSSVLEKIEFSSKSVQSDKGVCTQDTSPMSIPHDVEEKKVKLPIHQLDEDKDKLSTVEGKSNVLVEPRPTKKVHSDLLLDQEGISGIASTTFSKNFPSQNSDSELLPQEKLKLDDVDQHIEPLGSIYPALGLLPEALNTDPVEMPPLPPLPPVQWRMGKTQQACLAHETAIHPNDNISFPSMSVADHRAQAPKLIVPSLANAADASLLTISDTSDQDHPSSLQMPISVNHANISHLQSLGGMHPVDQNLLSPGSNPNLLSVGEMQLPNDNLPVPENCADLADVTDFRFLSENLLLPANNFPSLSETQSLNQHLPLPTKLDEMPRHDDHSSTSLNAPSSGTNGDADAACDVEQVVDSATLVQFNKAQGTGPNNILGQGSASSESNTSTRDASALLTKINGERPPNMMLSLEGETAWPEQDEGKPYGVRPMKPPRQRNPLIDAVIALDKSKLRKVAEQPKAWIQKVDERDSALKNLQLRKVTEQPITQIQKADERDSVLENLQLRKVTEHSRAQIQKADGRDSVLENLKLRKVTEQPRRQIQKAVEKDSVLENFQLRKVTEPPSSEIQKLDEEDSVLENLQLRKVTEPPKTQIQKADERDSLLEQIRAKTFNLKPSVPSRPAVQGPTTSLKVAAILEKAKTMRQAFAGSDDEDDDDSWSDS